MANITDIERLNYYEGEFLGAADFQAEQDYHRDMRRRHNVGQHTWGIVSGLDLVQVLNGGTTPPPGNLPTVDIYLQPGVAVDAFGREIVVLNKTQLTQDLFASFGNLTGLQTMYLWISYAQLMLQPPSDACTQINQPNSFGRVQEAFALTVTNEPNGPTDDTIIVDGKPVAAPVLPGDIVFPPDESIPYQEFPTDDSPVWYVPLGRVYWDASNGVFVQQTQKQLDDTWLAVGRQYTGIVTSTVYAPAASTAYSQGPALTLKDRFTASPLPSGSNGVSVEVEGSLTVDLLLNAEQNILVGSTFNPASTLTISPVTINASQTDQSFIQFRDSTGPTFSIWETLGTTSPNNIPPGLNFGEADNKSGKPTTSDLFIQSGKVGIGTSSPSQNLSVNGGLNIDQAAQNNGGSLNPGLSFGSNGTEGIASGQAGGATNPSGLDFYTSNQPRLSISSDGKVGIGTGAPKTKLQVEGASDPLAAVAIRRSDNNKFMRIGVGSSGVALDFDPTSYFVVQKNTFGIDGIFNGPGLLFVGGDGKVGIATTTPSHQLEVVDAGSTGLRVQTNTAGGTVASFGGFGDFQIDAPGVVGGRFIVKESGTVGIGITTPAATLDVQGTFHAAASVAGGQTSTGWVLGGGASGPDNWLRLTKTPLQDTYHDFAVNSFWAAGSQRFDLAEVTPANAEDALEQGDVVVIDRECGMQVTRSSKPFDTSVYGVVSSYNQASMVIGGFGGPEAVKGDSSKLPIALVGRAKAKVTDENGPIEVGDLLTTSSTPGHLMRCGSSRCIGSIVGKALESLTEEFGVITIRVSLH